MTKTECDVCGKIHDPSESESIKFDVYPCVINVCPTCWDDFIEWTLIRS